MTRRRKISVGVALAFFWVVLYGLYTIANLRYRPFDSMAMSDDENTLVLVTHLGNGRDQEKELQIDVIDLQSQRHQLTIMHRDRQFPRRRVTVALSPDGTKLAVSKRGQLRVYDTRRSWMQSPWDFRLSETADASEVSFSPDSRFAFVLETHEINTHVHAFDLSTGEHRRCPFPLRTTLLHHVPQPPSLGKARCFAGLSVDEMQDVLDRHNTHLFAFDDWQIREIPNATRKRFVFFHGFSRDLKWTLEYMDENKEAEFGIVNSETRELAWKLETWSPRPRWRGEDQLVVENWEKQLRDFSGITVFDGPTGEVTQRFRYKIGQLGWEYRSAAKEMVFADSAGKLTVIDRNGDVRTIRQGDWTSRVPIVVVWAMAATVWWFVLGNMFRQCKRSYRLFWITLALFAIASLPVIIRTYMGPEPRILDDPSSTVLTGVLTALTGLMSFWSIFSLIRWPSRLTMQLLVYVVVLGVLAVLRKNNFWSVGQALPMMLLISISAFPLLFFGVLRMLRMRLIHHGDPVSGVIASSKDAFRIRDIVTWTLASAMLLFFVRDFVIFTSTEAAKEAALSGVLLASLIAWSVWLVLGRPPFWLRMLITALGLAAVIGLLATWTDRSWQQPFDVYSWPMLLGVFMVTLVAAMMRRYGYRLGFGVGTAIGQSTSGIVR